MVMVSPRMHLSKWLVLMISIICMTSDGRARARILVSNKVTGFDKPKGAVKTIESYETGEVIDCVDIFKQPAFDHPFLKNYTTQMKLRQNRKANRARYMERGLSQAWWKYGECPEGTIPIKRPQNHTDYHVTPLTRHMKRLNLSKNDVNSEDGHDYAIVSLSDGNYNGAHAGINLWNPTVVDSEASFSQIWLSAGPDEDVNTVEAGWMVNKGPGFTGQAEFFTYWTSDGYNKRGCYNVQCRGFVQMDEDFILGSAIQPVSTYDGQQYDIKVEIKKDMLTGSWVLSVTDKEVGFWPDDLFTHLRGPADQIDWGGETGKAVPDGRPTSTQMGSGHFPSEGYEKASYFRNLKFFDDEYDERDPENLKTHVTRPESYDLVLNEDPLTTFGVSFFYGGPGIST